MMKRLLILLLLVPCWAMAQTKFTKAEINAASGNRWEYLIVGTFDGEIEVQMLLNRMEFSPDISRGKVVSEYEFLSKWVHTNDTNGEVVIWEQQKVKGKGLNRYTTELDLWGDAPSIIKFYINFWSRALDFRNTKPGETVTVRFLTDIAALTVNHDGTARITVRSAQDRAKE